MEKKRFRVVVDPAAYRMMEGHVAFLAQVSAEAAHRLRRQFMRALRSLETQPERHPYLQSAYIPPDKYRKMIVHRRYLFLYEVKGDEVHIDHIVDGRGAYGYLMGNPDDRWQR